MAHYAPGSDQIARVLAQQRSWLQLHRAAQADVELLCTMFTAIYAHDNHPREFNRDLIADELLSPQKYLFVFADERELLLGGFRIMWLPDAVDIIDIGTMPLSRRRGVNQELLATIVELAREAALPSITLEVRDSNVAARNAYEKFGFKTDGRRRNYYDGYVNPVGTVFAPEDAVLMRYNI